MSNNAKKIIDSLVEKKIKSFERKKKTKVNLDDYHDAIVDGKFIAKEKAKLYFERTILGKTAIHEGYVFSTKENLVTIFDETKEQFYGIDITKFSNKIKVASKDDIVLSENDSNN